MDDMPRPRPPHLHRQVTRHRKTVWYVRIDKGRRIRIRAAFGSPEFDMEYQAALAGNSTSRARSATAGTLAWLIERYRETTAWADLSPATRRNRENHFKQVIETAGYQPIRAITQAVIIAARDRRAATPAQARNFLDALRGLFWWAKRPNTSPSIRPKPSRILSGKRGRVFRCGLKRMPQPTTSDGPSGPRNASGATYCSTPACGAETPFVWAASMSVTALPRYEPKRVKAR